MSYHWWVEKLESLTGENGLDWEHEWTITAHLTDNYHANPSAPMRPRGVYDWPMAKGENVVTVAHWCRDNCRGAWHIGTMDQVYFSDTEEAMLFLMSHSK